MTFCSNCGKELNDDAKFCPACGKATAVEAEAQTNTDAQPEQQAEQSNTQYTYTAPNSANNTNDIFKTEDKTADFDPMDISSNKAMGILAYFGLLVLVPIFAAPNSKFARFHANQGLVLFIIEAAYGIARSILLAILKATFNYIWGLKIIYWAISVVTGIVPIAFFILAILGIVDAAQGKAKKLPVIGKFDILK